MIRFDTLYAGGYVVTARPAAKAAEVLLPTTPAVAPAPRISANKRLRAFQQEMDRLGMLPPGPLNAIDNGPTLTEQIKQREYVDDPQPDNNILLPIDMRLPQ